MKDRNIRKNRKKLFGGLAIAFVFLVVLFYVTVAKSGFWLVQNDEFTHVKWAVLLDGQTADLERDDFAAKLMSEGKIDSIVILGRRVYRDKSNADFYAEDFMRLGKFDSSAVFLARHDDPSTISEAYTVIPWLKLHKADTVLLITAAPATKRAVRIFSELSGESPVYLSVDIQHHQYYADSWIFNRESRKNWLHEWAALAHSHWDLLGTDTLEAADQTYDKRIRNLKAEAEDEPFIDLSALQKKEIPEPAKDTVAKDSVTAKPDSAKADTSKADAPKDKGDSAKSAPEKKPVAKADSANKDSAKK